MIIAMVIIAIVILPLLLLLLPWLYYYYYCYYCHGYINIIVSIFIIIIIITIIFILMMMMIIIIIIIIIAINVIILPERYIGNPKEPGRQVRSCAAAWGSASKVRCVELLVVWGSVGMERGRGYGNDLSKNKTCGVGMGWVKTL